MRSRATYLTVCLSVCLSACLLLDEPSCTGEVGAVRSAACHAAGPCTQPYDGQPQRQGSWGGVLGGRGHATNGELAYGPGGKKSSAQPDKVPALEGVDTYAVAAGQAHTLFLVRSSTGPPACCHLSGQPAINATGHCDPLESCTSRHHARSGRNLCHARCGDGHQVDSSFEGLVQLDEWGPESAMEDAPPLPAGAAGKAKGGERKPWAIAIVMFSSSPPPPLGLL